MRETIAGLRGFAGSQALIDKAHKAAAKLIADVRLRDTYTCVYNGDLPLVLLLLNMENTLLDFLSTGAMVKP